jgi:hypothetical protein
LSQYRARECFRTSLVGSGGGGGPSTSQTSTRESPVAARMAQDRPRESPRSGADVPDKAKLFAHGGQGRQDVPEERQGVTLTRAVINLRP